MLSKGFLRERPSASPPSSLTGAVSENPKNPAEGSGSETAEPDPKPLADSGFAGASNPPAIFGTSEAGVVTGAENAFDAGAGSAEKGFSFAEDGVGQVKAVWGAEAATGFSAEGAVKGEEADGSGAEPVVTGDQKGLAGASAAPDPVNEGFAKTGLAAALGVSGVAPNRGGSVTIESFSGVISAAKSSGQIW